MTPALFYDENLLSLVICRMVNLSLEHGNSDGSCFAYVWFAIIAGPRFGNYKAGFRFGRLGYELVEKRGLKRYPGQNLYVFRKYRHAMDETCPGRPRSGTPRLRCRQSRSATSPLRLIAAISLITNFLAAGDPLAEVQREAENGLEFAQKARFGLVIDIITRAARVDPDPPWFDAEIRLLRR